MPTTMTGTGVTYTSGNTQTQPRTIVKHRMTGLTQVDQGIQSGGWDFVTGSEINMGVPQKSNNWYRLEYYTDGDDQGPSNGGWGCAIYRNTPSTGWERVLDQGWHAQYESNAGDFYTTGTGLFFVPVHPSYPTQVHSFRLYARRHPDVGFRIQCSIGADLRQAGWQNGMFECYELDGDLVTANNLTRY
jgi:hypothetical protein